MSDAPTAFALDQDAQRGTHCVQLLVRRPGIGSHQSAAMMKDEWLTPPDIIKALGPFDLDPCAPIVRPWPTAAFARWLVELARRTQGHNAELSGGGPLSHQPAEADSRRPLK